MTTQITTEYPQPDPAESIGAFTLQTPQYEFNRDRPKGEGYPCLVCGRIVREGRGIWVPLHDGGSTIVTSAEYDRLNALGFESWALGCYPIGPDCIKKHPELRRFEA